MSTGNMSGPSTKGAQQLSQDASLKLTYRKDGKEPVSDAGKALGANIETMFNELLKPHFEAVQTAADAGKDTTAATVALAADVATLHNMQREYAHAEGNFELEKKLRDDPSLIAIADGNNAFKKADAILGDAQKNISNKIFTNQLDFMGVRNSGTGSDDGSQKVTAQLRSDPKIQATSGFVGGGVSAAAADGKSRTTVETSSAAHGRASDWAAVDNKAQIATGAFYEPSQAAQISKDVLQNVNGATPADKTTAFAYMGSLDDEGRKKLMQSAGPQGESAWNEIKQKGESVGPAPNPTTDKKSFDTIYNRFAGFN